MTSSISSPVRIWKIRNSGSGCSFVWILRVVYFSVKHSCPYNAEIYFEFYRLADCIYLTNNICHVFHFFFATPSCEDYWPGACCARARNNMLLSLGKVFWMSRVEFQVCGELTSRHSRMASHGTLCDLHNTLRFVMNGTTERRKFMEHTCNIHVLLDQSWRDNKQNGVDGINFPLETWRNSTKSERWCINERYYSTKCLFFCKNQFDSLARIIDKIDSVS